MRKGLDAEIPDEITIQANRESVAKIVEFVSAHAREMTFTEERIGRIAQALEEAVGNIVHFACPLGTEEITVTCQAHEMGSMVLDIIDSGEPYNMLLESTFPDFTGTEGEKPSTKIMKKVVKDVEYRRDGENRKNILAWVVQR